MYYREEKTACVRNEREREEIEVFERSFEEEKEREKEKEKKKEMKKKEKKGACRINVEDHNYTIKQNMYVNV